jgi:hypothetical protein
MPLYPRVSGSYRNTIGGWVKVAGVWRQIVGVWQYDADRPHDLDVDPPIEVPTGDGGVGVWVHAGTPSPPPADQVPSNPGVIAQDINNGGGSFTTRARAVWDTPGGYPYNFYAAQAEIQSCGEIDVFTPDGNWVFWANAGAAQATAEQTNNVDQAFAWTRTWLRARVRYSTSAGYGTWSAWSSPTRVTLRFS